MSENLLSGVGLGYKETETSHLRSSQRWPLPPRSPTTDPLHFPPGLTYLHHHPSSPQGLAISTSPLSQAHSEDDIYFIADTNSPKLSSPPTKIIKKGREKEKGQLCISEQITKLLYVSISSPAKIDRKMVPTLIKQN